MQVTLIDIGTSKGIRIPANVLKDLDRPNSFDLKVEKNKIILDIINNPRDGWDDKFKDTKNDLLIDDSLDLDQWDAI